MTGEKIGQLEVIQLSERTRRGETFWECRCECGNITHVRAGDLRRPTPTSSCGCNQGTKRSGCGEVGGWYWCRVKNSAKDRGHEVSVSIEDAWELFQQQGGLCALSGDPIKLEPSLRRNEQTASLDRKDPAKGYVAGNIQWVHKDINFMKQQMTNEEFIEQCNRVTSNSGRFSSLPFAPMESSTPQGSTECGTTRSEPSAAA
jgi:hypothetical protein